MVPGGGTLYAITQKRTKVQRFVFITYYMMDRQSEANRIARLCDTFCDTELAMHMKHLVKRGNVFWFRMRRPKRYEHVFSSTYITESLRTDSRMEAEALSPQVKQRWLIELKARASGKAFNSSADAFKAMVELANSEGLRPTTANELANGSLEALLGRLLQLQTRDPAAQSALFAATLGGFELPQTLITEAAENMAQYLPTHVQNKNARQKRTWANKYKRAAAAFVAAVQDKPIANVTRDDAYLVRRYWVNRVYTEEIATTYAQKHIGYLRSLVDAFYTNFEIDEYINPFKDLNPIEKPNWEKLSEEYQKPEFTPKWIKETILTGEKLAGLNQQARDILIICAETGCRQTEIYDLPKSSIKLSENVPHLDIKLETSGDHKREIKTRASTRKVPLVGAALDAMRRNPFGFPAYRGKGSFSNTVAKYFKENHLLPTMDHQLSGLRHSYETRMRRARIDNEERGFMMGHSIKKIRGREVYGNRTKLEIQALLAELVVFPTATWHPRPPDQIHALIDRILEDEGHRISSSSL
ncbi:DUF6538 domain-containing protein [Sulfitobacter sp. 1A12157]|uniref:DUF6538 domain-containing protein n=1 Tax=Sulfitobacter sp. 1A12157 TaxID=3368594 RepID=UPI003745533D